MTKFDLQITIPIVLLSSVFVWNVLDSLGYESKFKSVDELFTPQMPNPHMVSLREICLQIGGKPTTHKDGISCLSLPNNK